jgi:hypothetical protein
MYEQQTTAEITIIYPQRPGFIMEAHTLKQEIVYRFGLSVLLDEGKNDYFTVVLNGTIIHSKPIEGNVHIDYQEIINAVANHKNPLVLNPEVPSEPDDDADPDHLRWMNSVCSGE